MAFILLHVAVELNRAPSLEHSFFIFETHQIKAKVVI